LIDISFVVTIESKTLIFIKLHRSKPLLLNHAFTLNGQYHCLIWLDAFDSLNLEYPNAVIWAQVQIFKEGSWHVA